MKSKKLINLQRFLINNLKSKLITFWHVNFTYKSLNEFPNVKILPMQLFTLVTHQTNLIISSMFSYILKEQTFVILRVSLKILKGIFTYT